MTPLPPPRASAPNVRRFFTLLHAEGTTFEIRIPRYGKFKFTASGYFDDVDAAVATVERWDSLASIYITLNSVKPSLLARAVNRIADRADATTSDVDILRRTNLLIDIDAVPQASVAPERNWRPHSR